jgi:hypothetical protein
MTAQKEIAPMPISIPERQTKLLAMLYELRAQTMMASDAAARLKWLVVSQELRQSHDSVCRAISIVEQQHPELT